jgi:hypothetical protein
MIDWTGRIDELMDFLIREYSLAAAAADRPGVELLLSLSIQLPDGQPAPRVILETDWLTRDCTAAWFAFGGKIVPHAIATLNGMRAAQARILTEKWSAEWRPAVFVDAEWRRPRRWAKCHSGSGYSLSESFQEALRARVRSPKSLSVLSVDSRAAESRAGRLRYLTENIVYSETRGRLSPRVILPADYGYWCELAIRLARPGVGWEWMVNAVASVAVRHAYIYDRQETEAEDWRLAARVLAWQAPAWTTGLLERIAEGSLTRKGVGKPAWRGYVGPAAGELESQKDLRAELRRLVTNGVIRASFGWIKGEGTDWENTIRLLRGEAFGS